MTTHAFNTKYAAHVHRACPHKLSATLGNVFKLSLFKT